MLSKCCGGDRRQLALSVDQSGFWGVSDAVSAGLRLLQASQAKHVLPQAVSVGCKFSDGARPGDGRSRRYLRGDRVWGGSFVSEGLSRSDFGPLKPGFMRRLTTSAGAAARDVVRRRPWV